MKIWTGNIIISLPTKGGLQFDVALKEVVKTDMSLLVAEAQGKLGERVVTDTVTCNVLSNEYSMHC